MGCVVNWRELIIDLNRAGFSCAEIGRRVNASPKTINGLKNEDWHEPGYALGAALIDLHARMKSCGLIKQAA